MMDYFKICVSSATNEVTVMFLASLIEETNNRRIEYHEQFGNFNFNFHHLVQFAVLHPII